MRERGRPLSLFSFLPRNCRRPDALAGQDWCDRWETDDVRADGEIAAAARLARGCAGRIRRCGRLGDRPEPRAAAMALPARQRRVLAGAAAGPGLAVAADLREVGGRPGAG